jgi:plastocyanin
MAFRHVSASARGFFHVKEGKPMKLLSTIVMVAPVLALSSGTGSYAPRWDEAPAAIAQETRSDGDAPAVEDPKPQVVEIGISGMTFAPASVVISPGGTVVWKNADKVAHTATATDKSWDSGTIQPGGSWRRRFETPGTYAFFCMPHPGMSGTVVVKAK